MTSGISIIDKSYMNFPYAHINWDENTVKWWNTANDGQGAQLNVDENISISGLVNRSIFRLS